MKKSAIFALSLLLSCVPTLSAQFVKIITDEQTLTYRLEITAGTNEVEYDVSAIEAPSPELCPRGIVMFIRSSAGQLLNCSGSQKGPQRGYSSSWMSSTLPIVSYKFNKLPDNSVFKTESLQISNVMFGLGPCLGAKIASASQIKLAFTTRLRVNGVESNYTAETDWLPFSDALRKSIRPQPR